MQALPNRDRFASIKAGGEQRRLTPLRHTGRDKIRGRERSIDEHSVFQPQGARETGVFGEISVASLVKGNISLLPSCNRLRRFRTVSGE